MPVSVAYIQSLGACWTAAQLAASSEAWPSAEPSWSWFLGDRLQLLPRGDALLRVQVALAHVVQAQLVAPQPPRALWGFFRACDTVKFVTASQALGAWLDAQDGPSFDALSAVLVP